MSVLSPFPSAPLHSLKAAARRLALYALAIVVSLAFVFPLYWMLVTAIIPVEQAFHFPPYFFPAAVRLDAFREIIERQPILTWLTNSLIMSLSTTLLTLTMSITGAYALSKTGWRGRRGLGFGLL